MHAWSLQLTHSWCELTTSCTYSSVAHHQTSCADVKSNKGLAAHFAIQILFKQGNFLTNWTAHFWLLCARSAHLVIACQIWNIIQATQALFDRLDDMQAVWLPILLNRKNTPLQLLVKLALLQLNAHHVNHLSIRHPAHWYTRLNNVKCLWGYTANNSKSTFPVQEWVIEHPQ